MTPTKVYINGKLYDKADAKISVYDHGLLYGDGVFEGIRIYDGKVFRLKEHVDRLFESARAIKLEIPLSREQMVQAIQDTVAANDKRNGYIRPIVTRGAGTLGLDPRKTGDPQVIIIVDDISPVSAGAVRERPGDRDGRDDPQPSRRRSTRASSR